MLSLPTIKPQWLVVLLIMQLALPILSTDIYLPSLKEIGVSLHASSTQVQSTLTCYFFSIGIVQLIYGPLSDRFGRKPMLLLSLLIYILATLICMLATSLQMLILGRCLQALGAGSAILTFAIIRDLYEGKQVAQMIAYMSAVVAISPIVAPIIGSYLQLLSWRWDFTLLDCIGLILLILCYCLLPETRKCCNTTTSFVKQSLLDYRFLVVNRSYMGNALAAAFAFGALFAYVSGSPYVLINIIQCPPQLFGWLFAIATIGYVLGAIASGKLVSRFGINIICRIGMISLVGGAITMTLLCYLYPINSFTIVIPQLICEFGISIVISTCVSKALQPIPNLAGAGSALLGLLRFLCAAFSSYLITVFHTTTSLSLALTILAFSVVSLITLYLIFIG